MTMTMRKGVIVVISAAILLPAGAYTIVSWLGELGLIHWAQAVRDEYLPGPTITIIVVLLVLVGAPAGCLAIRRCPVCEHVVLRPGKYCAACGSRV
jgi:hypothetical protein